jgi:SPP1 gp7 family putative phage head morphogenesis protein
MRRIIRGVHSYFLEHLDRAMETVVHTDARVTGNPTADVDRLLRAVLPQLGPKVKAAHTKMAQASNTAYNSTMKEILPVGFHQIGGRVEKVALKARDESIQLVEKATRAYADDVRKVFNDPKFTHGTRVEDLRDALIARGNVSESRADLIARDQTLKLNGAINQARQTSVGIDAYVWSTAGDERVRDEHAELDGQTFQWNAPPSVGHPGEDFQCRCIAMPVISELADLDL